MGRDNSFLEQLRKDSKNSPSGVELEVDLESVYEHLFFSPSALKIAAEVFTESTLIQDYLIEALKDEIKNKLFDSDIREEMVKILSHWKMMARPNTSTTNQQKTEALVKAFNEDDGLAATILKISMLKFISHKNRQSIINNISSELKTTLFKALPDLRDKNSNLRAKFDRSDTLSFLIEHIIRKRNKEFILSIGQNQFTDFLKKISVWLILKNEREIMVSPLLIRKNLMIQTFHQKHRPLEN